METIPTELVVYHCRNLRFFSNGQQKVFARSHPGLRLVSLPCSGKVEAHHLLKTLAGGAQGVLVLGCAEKACQYLEGSMRSQKRVEYARSWLTRLDIEPERLQFLHVPPMDAHALERTVEEFARKLKTFGTVSPVASFPDR